MDKKLFLFILASASVILAASLILPKTRLNQSEMAIENTVESPTVYTIEADEETTAFGLLKELAEKENIELVTQQYDFGVFVKSVGGKESGAEMAWIYFVNGESGQVAADQMKINPGDKVEWKYITPSEE